MKILKKTILILLISIMLLYSIIPSKTVYADDSETLSSSAEAGQIIANFARDMVENHAHETIYDFGDYWFNPNNPYYNNTQNYGRLMAYQGVKVTGYAQGSDGSTKYAENKYFMDCVGFVSFCIHHSLGISGNADGNFVAPDGLRSSSFQYVGDSLQPGDILIRSGSHVMIYVSENYVVEAQDVDETWQIKRRSSWPTYDYVARIKDSEAKKILRSNTKNAWDGQGSGGVYVPEVDDSEQFDIYISEGNPDGLGNSNKFYYNGVPKSGEYLGKTEEGNWLFNTLEDAADWLIGIMTLSTKIQVIGWTNIFEGVANDIVEGLTLENLEERITVEDIIYNKVPILDVNVFNFEQAGGQDLPENNIIYILRTKVASWYVVIRTISIILLLFTLLYLGIRTAISSVASEKAEYKQKLIAWVVSFMVVMFIHYFMIIVLNLNEIAISWVTPNEQASTATVYEQMREYAYEIPATKGWTGTIIYVFLVYYLIKMLLFYFKRVLIVYILAIISPALGIAYSIQRINGKSKALGIWAKEFAFNVLIQFVHAIIYTIMMSIILKFTANIPVLSIIPYAVILFALLNFLLKAEDIIKNIFKIETSSLKRVLDTVFDLKNKLAPAIVVAGFGYKYAKQGVTKLYDNHLTESLNAKYDKYKIPGDSEIAKSTNEQIERLKQQEKAHITELNTNAINLARNTFSGAVALVTGVPALFEKPIVGATNLAYTASTLNATLGRGKQGYEADRLERTTEGNRYLYIDEPSETNTNASTTGNGGASGTNGNTKTQSGQNASSEKEIRTYNTSKNKKYTIVKGAISWATLGRSTMLQEVIAAGKEEEELIYRVYEKRIQKLSVIGERGIKELGVISKELDLIKNNKYPPIYYTPVDGETKAQITINERLREKYIEILQKNIKEIYEGIDKEKLEGHVEEGVINKTSGKVTLKSVEEIAQNYLAENECELGKEFKDNFETVLKDKIVKTADSTKDESTKVLLKPEVEEKILEAIEDNKDNKKQQKAEIDKIITEDVQEEVVSKLSVKDLTELLSKTLEKDGSIEMNREFKNLQEPIENLRALNKESVATAEAEMYTTEQLLDLILNKDIME